MRKKRGRSFRLSSIVGLLPPISPGRKGGRSDAMGIYSRTGDRYTDRLVSGSIHLVLEYWWYLRAYQGKEGKIDYS
jgi:hypothetical protein